MRSAKADGAFLECITRDEGLARGQERAYRGEKANVNGSLLHDIKLYFWRMWLTKARIFVGFVQFDACAHAM